MKKEKQLQINNNVRRKEKVNKAHNKLEKKWKDKEDYYEKRKLFENELEKDLLDFLDKLNSLRI